MRHKSKILVKWTVGAIITASGALAIWYFYISGYFAEGNDSVYSVENTPVLKSSPLEGKTLFFLGSSVTAGFAAREESFADYIAKRNNCIIGKEAKGATVMMDNGQNSYVERIKKLDTKAKVDIFICQLSTNDTRYNGLKKIGRISQSTNIQDLDRETTVGAIEYIIAYAKKTWNCPVVFYTNSYFEDKYYSTVIKKLYDVQKKWDISIIDLYNNEKFNNISEDQMKLYMLSDHVHPHRSGYKLWWTPEIEKHLYKIVNPSGNWP